MAFTPHPKGETKLAKKRLNLTPHNPSISANLYALVHGRVEDTIMGSQKKRPGRSRLLLEALGCPIPCNKVILGLPLCAVF